MVIEYAINRYFPGHQPSDWGYFLATDRVIEYMYRLYDKNRVYLLELARFHQFPFISVKDAFFPAFTRFYSYYPNSVAWPLSRKIDVSLKLVMLLSQFCVGDGIHTTEEGCRLVANRLLVPFFVKQFRHRHGEMNEATGWVHPDTEVVRPIPAALYNSYDIVGK